jgi:ADP-ribose pyrophosphatase YjhB (NUDIX family)
MNQPIVEVASIVMHEGKVLIGRSSEGKWETPTTPVSLLEEIKVAGIRTTFELAGITVDPQQVLFFGEEIKADEKSHRIFIYLYAQYVRGELKPSGTWTEAIWADVRELAKYQDNMSDATIDGFYKFSLCLKSMAQRKV